MCMDMYTLQFSMYVFMYVCVYVCMYQLTYFQYYVKSSVEMWYIIFFLLGPLRVWWEMSDTAIWRRTLSFASRRRLATRPRLSGSGLGLEAGCRPARTSHFVLYYLCFIIFLCDVGLVLRRFFVSFCLRCFPFVLVVIFFSLWLLQCFHFCFHFFNS